MARNWDIGAVGKFMKKYPFLMALLVILVFGYIFGKDMAMKHNAQDAAQRATASETESR